MNCNYFYQCLVTCRAHESSYPEPLRNLLCLTELKGLSLLLGPLNAAYDVSPDTLGTEGPSNDSIELSTVYRTTLALPPSENLITLP